MPTARSRTITRRSFLKLAGLSAVLASCSEVLEYTPSPLPSTTPAPTSTPTARPTRTATPTVTPSSTETPTPLLTAAPTAAPSPTQSPDPTATPASQDSPLRVISLIHGPYRALVVDGVLQRFGLSATNIRVDKGEAVPDLTAYDAVVFAGGEYGPDEFGLAFFEAEKARIMSALESSIPILGICLGNQLLAHWLGGEVAKGRWEIGWLPVEVNEAGQSDPLLAGLGLSFYAFLWHGDRITRLPEGAELLASTERCPIQVFRLRDRPVWGVQFNPQYDPVIAEGVLRSAQTLPGHGYDVDQMVATGYREYDDLAGRLFGNFLIAAQSCRDFA